MAEHTYGAVAQTAPETPQEMAGLSSRPALLQAGQKPCLDTALDAEDNSTVALVVLALPVPVDMAGKAGGQLQVAQEEEMVRAALVRPLVVPWLARAKMGALTSLDRLFPVLPLAGPLISVAFPLAV